ncbi:MAG TPA: carbohydrate kinase family protein [Chthoniobacterales bacterium]|nr:carbohydrate kinase family protein [Chthoniobacterales bacterium]
MSAVPDLSAIAQQASSASMHRSSATAERSGILAAGNWIVDHLKVIDLWPSQDALAIIQSESDGNGGSPFNVLIDLSRLGAVFPLQGAGVIGTDSAGDWILNACRQNRIDVSSMHRTDAAPTSYTDVMSVASTGRRTFFHQRGANALLKGSDIELESSSAKLFHLGYLLLLDSLDAACPTFGTKSAELLHRASELGFVTSADVVSEESDRYRQIVFPALRHLDLLFMNEFEAGRMVDSKIRVGDAIDRDALVSTAEMLMKAGIRQWLIIHFPEGILALSSGGKKLFQPSLKLPPERIKGATGAGDAVTAGVLFGYLKGLPMETCLLYGVCAAAACMQHPSASDGVLPLPKCLEFADELSFRPNLF